jgi:hypothetical protein
MMSGGGDLRRVSTAAEISVADSTDRSWTYERDPRGAGVLADRDRGVLIGAALPDVCPSRWQPGPAPEGLMDGLLAEVTGPGPAGGNAT